MTSKKRNEATKEAHEVTRVKQRAVKAIKAEFDGEFAATAQGGAVLAEKAMRSLGMRRLIADHLPSRSSEAQYSTADGAYALLAGLMVGGQGLGAASSLGDDELLKTIFGLEAGVPSVPTMYRVLCDLGGLDERKESETYVDNGRTLAAMDLFGRERRVPKRRRVVPAVPESASAENLGALEEFGAAVAKACVRALPKEMLRLHGWYTLFGDASDLEVEGNCFDAARMGRNGEKVIRWQTVMLGPVCVAQQVNVGNEDEGRSMPRLLDVTRRRVREILGAWARVLLLMDAAYFERAVLDDLKWDFIVCANQHRAYLTRLAEQQLIWADTGADDRRGWAESQVCCFSHRPEGWRNLVTVVARRWREDGELPGTWHYSFVATRLQPRDLPADLLKKHGYCSLIWMLYGTKQGHEPYYKTFLRDFGLHHPPSCRLGINQAFFTLGVAAANVAMVLRYRVVDKEERGIEVWRLRQRYFQIAARVIKTGRTLTVYLSGVCVSALRQALWRNAFAAAGQL